MTISRRKAILSAAVSSVAAAAVAQSAAPAASTAPALTPAPSPTPAPGSVDPATRRRVPFTTPGQPGAKSVAPLSVITNIEGRSKTSLDGQWRYVVDPFDTIRKKPRDRRNVFNDQIERPDTVIIEYEWETSPTFAVPNDWNTHVEAMHYYDGTTYFRRLFDSQPAAGRRRFLAFDAVNYRSTVWLNRQNLGGHEGGFTPFSFEVTDKLVAGSNVVVVRADNRHDDESLPAADFDWHNYGGITRSVWLIDVPQTFAKTWFVRLDGNQLLAEVQLDGPAAANMSVKIESASGGFSMSGTADAKGLARLTAPAPASLKLWSPESPTLHEVTLTAGEDVQKDKVGFRTVVVRGREILLNGKPVFLRGISMHEEPIDPKAGAFSKGKGIYQKGGRVVGKKQAVELLQTAKDLGCNFVRLAHYPHGEATLRAADEMGVLIWGEIPVYWEDVTYTSAKTLQLAKTMMGEMIVRDRNRASVILWSVANETPEIATRLSFLEAVIKEIRLLDPSRLITAALNKNADIAGTRPGEKRFVINDPLGAMLDVIGFNQYEAWYSPLTADDLAGVSFRSVYDKPIILSEFGSDAPLGYRAERTQRWSEDFQADLYTKTLAMIDKTEGLVGITPWLLKDFRSPRRWHGRFQQNWNRKGVISEDGQRKMAFDVLKKYYQSKR